jgi:CheY-like chemotaxis protein
MTRTTILIIEDDPNDVLFLQLAFKKAGITNPVQIAKDGREALKYLFGEGSFSDRERFPIPYLVFLDLKLPQVPGLEVLKTVREKPEFNSTVIIVLTSSSDPRDIDASYQHGANAYLVKPSGIDALTATMQSVKEFWLGKNQMASVFSGQSRSSAPPE